MNNHDLTTAIAKIEQLRDRGVNVDALKASIEEKQQNQDKPVTK